MKESAKNELKNKRKSNERRKALRYDISLLVHLRFMPDGTPVNGAAVEIGPNGMRVLSPMPLVEGSYVHVSFQSASNNTHCEGRIVWTQPTETDNQYESGIDIQRWGGGIPGEDPVTQVSKVKSKKDRRNKR